MFSLAIKGTKLMVRPHIPMLAENNVRVGFFERQTFDAVRAALPEALRPVATFAYLTGWRIPSEVLTLQWRQIDLPVGTIRLDPGTTKNRDGRLFPFGNHLPELRQLLDAAMEGHNGRGAGERRDLPAGYSTGRKARQELPRRVDGGMEPPDARDDPARLPAHGGAELERAGVSRSVRCISPGTRRTVYRRYAIVSEGDLGAGLEEQGQLGAGTI